MKKNSPRLIFVYNAYKGLPHKVLDFLHKSISPSTYQCDLCALTYGHFNMKKEWHDFIERLPLSVAFYYQEDFQQLLPGLDYSLPCVLLMNNGTPELLIGAEEMKHLDLDQLKATLQDRLAIELKKPV